MEFRILLDENQAHPRIERIQIEDLQGPHSQLQET
jgi:hypothetical protein